MLATAYYYVSIIRKLKTIKFEAYWPSSVKHCARNLDLVGSNIAKLNCGLNEIMMFIARGSIA